MVFQSENKKKNVPCRCTARPRPKTDIGDEGGLASLLRSNNHGNSLVTTVSVVVLANCMHVIHVVVYNAKRDL